MGLPLEVLSQDLELPLLPARLSLPVCYELYVDRDQPYCLTDQSGTCLSGIV